MINCEWRGHTAKQGRLFPGLGCIVWSLACRKQPRASWDHSDPQSMQSCIARSWCHPCHPPWGSLPAIGHQNFSLGSICSPEAVLQEKLQEGRVGRNPTYFLLFYPCSSKFFFSFDVKCVKCFRSDRAGLGPSTHRRTKHASYSLVPGLADNPLLWLIFGVINHKQPDSSLRVPCVHRGAHWVTY